MKNLVVTLIVYALFSTLIIAQTSNSVVLIGEVIDQKTKSIVIKKAYEDIREDVPEFPVKKGKFTYTLNYDEIEQYELIYGEEYGRAWRPIPFYPETDTIRFTLFSSEKWGDNIINSGPLTNGYYAEIKQMRQLEKEQMKSFENKMNDPHLSDSERAALQNEMKSLAQSMVISSFEKHSKHPTLLGFDLSVSQFNGDWEYTVITKELYLKHLSFWINQFPDTDRAERARNTILSITNVYEGGEIIDFELKDDVNSDEFLSSQLRNADYTLLDLWAPWCGPCIAKSKAIEKEYDLLSEKGLQVIGVIGGIQNIDAFHTAKNKHQYPWNLYKEIDSEQAIFQKYGVYGGGGGQFLIDKRGTIVALNPSLDLLKKTISK